MRNVQSKYSIFLGVLLTMNTTTITSESTRSSNRLTVINPPELYDPAPNGYSHAVVASGVAKLAFIAGQGGEDSHGDLSPDFETQVRQAYANLRTAIGAVGAQPHQVAKITTFVVDYDQSLLSVMTVIAKEFFGEALPAQTLVPVPRLALDGMLFEVNAVVVLD